MEYRGYGRYPRFQWTLSLATGYPCPFGNPTQGLREVESGHATPFDPWVGEQAGAFE